MLLVDFIVFCPLSLLGDFYCKDRRKCVAQSLICNGYSDCADGSDEMDCPATTTIKAAAPLKCRLGSQLCMDGSDCVLYSHVCDGEVDCKDGSDEEGCELWCKAGTYYLIYCFIMCNHDTCLN